MNQYEPWIDLNISEAEYFKKRYTEIRLNAEKLHDTLKMARHVIVDYLHCCCSGYCFKHDVLNDIDKALGEEDGE